MSTTDPDFYCGLPVDPELEAKSRAAAERHDAEQAAKHQAMRTEVTAEIAAMTGEQLSDAVTEAVEYLSISEAEYGMGAVSMGFDPYTGAPFESPRTSEFIRQGEARLRELYPPASTPVVTVDKDDLPF